jgi:hypothetical protein
MSGNNDISGIELALAIAAATLAVIGWRNRVQIAEAFAEALRQTQQRGEDQSEVIHDALPAPLMLPAFTGKKGSKL